MAFIDELREKQRTDTTVKDIQDEFASWFEERIQTYVKNKFDGIKHYLVSQVEKGATGTIMGQVGFEEYRIERFFDIPKELREKIKKHNVTIEVPEGFTLRDYNGDITAIPRWTKNETKNWSETKGFLLWKETTYYYEFQVSLTEFAKKIFVELARAVSQEGITMDLMNIKGVGEERIGAYSTTKKEVVLKGVNDCITRTFSTKSSEQYFGFGIGNITIPYSITL